MKNIFFISLLLISCKAHLPPPDTLSIALADEPKTLDPRRATDATGMRLVNLIFQGLVKIGPNLELLPDGARRWERQGLKYTFFLKDLFFSNGRPVSKEDILFSLAEFRKKSSVFYSAFKNIQDVQVYRVAKRLRVEITLKKFSATFLQADLPVIKILPKKEILNKKIDFSKKPFGTGHFTLESKTRAKILLKRREVSSAHPKYLSFLIVKDTLTRVQQILSGAIDLAPSVISPQKLFIFKKRNFKVVRQTGLSTTYLLMNLKNKHLKNLAVRQALAYTLDRPSLIKYKFKNYALLARSLMSPQNFFFYKQVPSHNLDLAKARKLLQGYPHPILLKFSTSNSQETVDKARVLMGQINKSPIKTRLETFEWGTFYQDLSRGQFDLALMKWVGVTDPDIYNLAFHSKNLAPKGRNRSLYKNPRLDRLLEQGIREPDKQKRRKIYERIQAIVHKNVLIIPLWHEQEISILKPSIKNYILPMNGSFSTLHLVEKDI